MRSALILGGTSDIGYAIAARYLQLNWAVILAGRHLERLNLIKNDLEIKTRGKVRIVQFDAEAIETHGKLLDELVDLPNLTICAFGYLGSQETAKQHVVETAKIINTNYLGAVSIINLISEKYKHQRSGTIVGISSVAGDRGRSSNYIYGSSKAGFTAYLSGLRAEMVNFKVQVLTVKPGFVETKMTRHLDLPQALTASPDRVAKGVLKAVKHKKNIIYILPVWRLIMIIICSIPEFIFKRLKL